MPTDIVDRDLGFSRCFGDRICAVVRNHWRFIMSVHCKECGQAKYLPRLATRLDQKIEAYQEWLTEHFGVDEHWSTENGCLPDCPQCEKDEDNEPGYKMEWEANPER